MTGTFPAGFFPAGHFTARYFPRRFFPRRFYLRWLGSVRRGKNRRGKYLERRSPAGKRPSTVKTPHRGDNPLPSLKFSADLYRVFTVYGFEFILFKWNFLKLRIALMSPRKTKHVCNLRRRSIISKLEKSPIKY